MNIKSTIQKVFNTICGWISMQYKKAHNKWIQEQRMLQEQQQNNNACMMQIQLQEALGHVLSSTHILPNLSAIQHPSDLVPDGFSIGDNQTVYYFRWTKRTPDAISTTVLNIAKNKINSAISFETKKMYYTFISLPDHEKAFFAQQYLAFYNGFQVILIKDAGTDVIVSAVFN